MPDFYVFQFLPLVLVETAALKFMKWGDLRRCLIDSLLMNGATLMGLLLGLAPKISSAGHFGLLLFCVYSVIVEGIVLTLMERHRTNKIWSSVLAANAAGIFLLSVTALYIAATAGVVPGYGSK